jgi:hypothetical protein
MNKDEIKELIENYRELVVKDYAEENTNIEMINSFKNNAKLFVKQQNKRTSIRRKNTLADLFYNKMGVFVNNPTLHQIKIKKLRKMKKNQNAFRALFIDLNTKLEVLEKKQRNNAFEVFNENAAVKYYYIPKNLLL